MDDVFYFSVQRLSKLVDEFASHKIPIRAHIPTSIISVVPSANSMLPTAKKAQRITQSIRDGLDVESVLKRDSCGPKYQNAPFTLE